MLALVPDALSRLGSDDAEDQEVLQTGADTDGNTGGGIGEGSGGTSARPGGRSILLGPPQPLHTTLRNSKEVKTELLRLAWSVWGGASQHTTLRIPDELSRAHLANMWLPLLFSSPVQGYFYPPDGWGRGGGVVSFGGQPCELDAGWRGLDPPGFRNPAVR